MARDRGAKCFYLRTFSDAPFLGGDLRWPNGPWPGERLLGHGKILRSFCRANYRGSSPWSLASPSGKMAAEGTVMPKQGWKQLLDGAPWFRGEGKYPVPAYSEFMPPPRLLFKPYDTEPRLFVEDDPWCWPVTEYEEAFWLRPGLEKIAHQVLCALVHLGNGRPAHGFARGKLKDNVYWPDELAAHAGKLSHERYVLLMPLALSRTQDDKGRVQWTLFGGSEQGPARGFWKSFYTSPGRERPPDEALAFVRRLLGTVYDEPAAKLTDLRAAGFRILPEEKPLLDFWGEGPLPAWTKPYILSSGESVSDI